MSATPETPQSAFGLNLTNTSEPEVKDEPVADNSPKAAPVEDPFADVLPKTESKVEKTETEPGKKQKGFLSSAFGFMGFGGKPSKSH